MLKPMRTSVFAFALACASAHAASDNEKAKREIPRGNDCVFFRSVFDWQGLDQNNMVIWAPNRRDAYHVYLSMPLIDLKSETQLAFLDRDRDGMLCGFSRDEIAITDRTFPQRASISAMKKLDAAGLAKLEEQFNTKLTRESKKKKPPTPTTEAAK